jgi:hypothetical protein
VAVASTSMERWMRIVCAKCWKGRAAHIPNCAADALSENDGNVLLQFRTGKGYTVIDSEN